MIINETTLGELCARVAAGDEGACHEFNRHVSPLVETLVRRWLSRQRCVGSGHDSQDKTRRSATPFDSESQISDLTGSICERMITKARAAARRPAHRQTSAPSAPSTLIAGGSETVVAWNNSLA